MLRNIDNFKLAQWYLVTTMEKNKRDAQRNSLQLQQANGEEQRKSAEQAAKLAADQQKTALQAEKDMKEYDALQQMKVEIIKGSFQIAAKAENPQPPQWLTSIIQQLIPNIQIPIAVENAQMQQAIAEEQQAQMMEQMAAEQQMMQEQEQPQMM